MAKTPEELDRDVELAESRLQVLEMERVALQRELSVARQQIKDIECRLRELVGSFSRTGLIARAKQDKDTTERMAKDSRARKVIWLTPRSWTRDRKQEWVVEKVTPKRIYIREPGSYRSSYYSRQTGAGRCEYDGVIYIEKTFPEGLDNFKP